MSHIARQFATIPVHFVANTCETEAVDIGHFAGGMFRISPAWTTAHVAVKIGAVKDSIFNPLYDKDNALVKITHPTPTYWYPLPDEVYGAHYIRLWSVSESGTGFNQAAERVVIIGLKG